jgi:hypothetical protein
MYLLAIWYLVFLAGGMAGAVVGLSFSESAFAPGMLLGMMASGHGAYRLSPFIFRTQEEWRDLVSEAEPWPGLPRSTGGSPSLRRLTEATERVSQTARAVVEFPNDIARSRGGDARRGPKHSLPERRIASRGDQGGGVIAIGR